MGLFDWGRVVRSVVSDGARRSTEMHDSTGVLTWLPYCMYCQACTQSHFAIEPIMVKLSWRLRVPFPRSGQANVTFAMHTQLRGSSRGVCSDPIALREWHAFSGIRVNDCHKEEGSGTQGVLGL